MGRGAAEADLGQLELHLQPRPLRCGRRSRPKEFARGPPGMAIEDVPFKRAVRAGMPPHVEQSRFHRAPVIAVDPAPDAAKAVFSCSRASFWQSSHARQRWRSVTAFPPWSRFDKSRFCLSASNICALKPGCLGAALRANSLVCGRVWAREAGASARGGDSAAGRSRRLFGPDESSSEVSNVANRYSSAIWMKRARRSVVSALRASSKQHSAKPSNCLVKVAFIARQQR